MSDVNKQLLEALKDLFASYKQLADSGDAGNWRIEDYPEGKQAIEAIAAAEQAQDDIGKAISQQAEPVAWDSIEAVAAGRYKVVPSHESMFYRFAVVAGDGEQQLYLGRKVECENMARKFSGAFLDGAFAYQQIIEPAQPPAVAVPDGYALVG